jgi:hydroxyacylglutathione hydrolase
MELQSLTTGPLQQICYLLWSNPQQVLLIDPGAEAKRIKQFIKDCELNIAAFICTHSHTDHIGALAE